MSDTVDSYNGGLIEDALALLQDTVPHGTMPPAPFGRVETNVVAATQYPDGHRAVVAASFIGSLSAEPEQEHSNPLAAAAQRQTVSAGAKAGLIGETLSIMRTVEPKAASSLARRTEAQLPQPESSLDMQRADMRRRVEAFKATQRRFQREREEYCAGALAAAQAGDWTPEHS
jgi:hypothetical protein